ncbi:MAG: class I SAM-dependent methyltransferase [Crocinitomicaceae bacterium]|nr:class I SAM-dependent methyltransferase [Crocinitomicaceae bacterium]
MKLGLEYIKYRRKAKRRHGIHSPFVYNLQDKVLRTKIDEDHNQALENLFNTLAANNDIIEIDDHGAGSKRLTNNRKISSIFKTSSSRGKYGRMLYSLARHYQPKTVLEFGTSLGIGSICMQLGNSQTKITTVEACTNTRKVALENFARLGIDHIESVQATFDHYLNSLKSESFDLVFIDGHHDGDALLHYLERLIPFTHNETIFVLDDIRWSESMLEAWNSVIQNYSYHVTLDFFRMGIVIPRIEQEKEHFVLNF